MRRLDLDPSLDAATEFLAPFTSTGVLGHADVHVAAAVARLVPEIDPDVLLAVAMAVRVTRLGHVCLEIDDPTGSIIEVINDPGLDVDDGAESADLIRSFDDLPWPAPDRWRESLQRSSAVSPPTELLSANPPSPTPPLVFDGNRVYLERYWRFEQTVAADLLGRAGDLVGGEGDSAGAEALLEQLFPPGDPFTDAIQRRAVEVALRRRLVVIGGGPGTGKTSTIAKLLAVIEGLALGRADATLPEIALAAPTGKAAARMTEAIQTAAANIPGLDDEVRTLLSELRASTIHRLLGSTGGLRFRRDADSLLTADVVVIDEASMISLPLMARLLDAISPDARLILLGDPNQLASIEAGAVLGDIVSGALPAGDVARLLTENVVLLERVFRVDAGAEAIKELASAINSGEPDAVIEQLERGGGVVRWIQPDNTAALDQLRSELLDNAVAVVRAATAGDIEVAFERMLELKVLAATRRGDFGVDYWRREIETAIAKHVRSVKLSDRWYIGRPVLVTANDRIAKLNNGDTGLVVARTDDGAVVDGRVIAVGSSGGEIREMQPSQLSASETWWSMTIHKSQGSEFGHTVVSLPKNPSPIVTRELLYTAVTRARSRVTIVAGRDVLSEAVTRRVARASGLADHLGRPET